jgi:hypothetical protein
MQKRDVVSTEYFQGNLTTEVNVKVLAKVIKNQKMNRNPDEMTPIFLLMYPQVSAVRKVTTSTADATMGDVGTFSFSSLEEYLTSWIISWIRLSRVNRFTPTIWLQVKQINEVLKIEFITFYLYWYYSVVSWLTTKNFQSYGGQDILTILVNVVQFMKFNNLLFTNSFKKLFSLEMLCS